MPSATKTFKRSSVGCIFVPAIFGGMKMSESFCLGCVWVCAVRDGGGAKLYPLSSGYWITADVFLP